MNATNTEKLKELIEVSAFPIIQKNLLKGFISRANEKEDALNKDRFLVEQTANEQKLLHIILSTDEVKIYTVYGQGEWEQKYPFRSIYFKEGKWQRSHTVSPSLDTAFLVYLEKKHLGDNSKFTDFALKMLEIKIEE